MSISATAVVHVNGCINSAAVPSAETATVPSCHCRMILKEYSAWKDSQYLCVSYGHTFTSFVFAYSQWKSQTNKKQTNKTQTNKQTEAIVNKKIDVYNLLSQQKQLPSAWTPPGMALVLGWCSAHVAGSPCEVGASGRK